MCELNSQASALNIHTFVYYSYITCILPLEKQLKIIAKYFSKSPKMRIFSDVKFYQLKKILRACEFLHLKKMWNSNCKQKETNHTEERVIHLFF